MNKKRILILDDEQAIHYVFDRMLQKDYKVLHATSIKDASKQVFLEKGVDLVIVDVFLGGETGIEFVGQIREFGHNIPVIIMSAYADEMTQELIRDIKKTFSCSFVKKPFDNEDMEQKIAAILSE